MPICKICGSKQIKTYKHPRFDMIFHECESCEVIYKDETNRITLKEEKNVYEQHENSIEDQGYVNFLTNFVDSALIPHIKKGHLLDFGSGPEPVLKEILNKRYHFDVDIYDYFYAKDESVFNHVYDGIISSEVFEHLWQPRQTLNQLKSVLKKDGILAIMTLFHPKEKDEFFDWFYIRDPSHVTFYTPKTFEVMADKVGFKVIETNNYRYITLKNS
jgi:SAM-dependent methyltransferase